MSDEVKVDEVVWPLDAGGYELEGQVGQGAFAKVYKAQCTNGRLCAVKVLDMEALGTGIDSVRAEVAVMKMCRHENVLPCYCSFSNGAELWVVMPYMDMGSCFHFMACLARKEGKKQVGMAEHVVAIILRKACEGLKYLHDNGHVHRDLKAGNILLDSKGGVRIADFGAAGKLLDAGTRKSGVKTFVGTPCWMAPEVMEQLSGYDTKADVWSLGITALELVKGYAPYSKLQPMQVLLKTIQDPPPSLKSYPADGTKFSRHFKELVTYCLQQKPAMRPSCDTLLRKKLLANARTKTTTSELARYLAQVPPLETTAAEGLPERVHAGALEHVPGTTLNFSTMAASSPDAEGEPEVTMAMLEAALTYGDSPAPAPTGTATATAGAAATAAVPVASTPAVADDAGAGAGTSAMVAGNTATGEGTTAGEGSGHDGSQPATSGGDSAAGTPAQPPDGSVPHRPDALVESAPGLPAASP